MSRITYGFLICSMVFIHGAIQSQSAQTEGAIVRVGNTELFRVYGPVGAFSQEDRANIISARLSALARNPFSERATVRVSEEKQQIIILLGSTSLMVVTDEDAQATGLSRIARADGLRARLQIFLRDEIYKTDDRAIVTSVLLTLGATLLLLGFLFGIFRLSAKLQDKIAKAQRRRPEEANVGEETHPPAIHGTLYSAIRWGRILLILLVTYVYSSLVFSFFPWSGGIAVSVLQYSLAPLKSVAGAILAYLPHFSFVLIAAIVARYAIKLLRWAFAELGSERLKLPGFRPEWAGTTFKILRVVALAVAAAAIFPYLPGAETPAFQGISIFVGVLVSLGSGSAIANTIAGVFMTYVSPFAMGDHIAVGETQGDVVEKTLLMTRIRTTKNVDITVPNSLILGSHVLNFSRNENEKGLILHVAVTVGYDIPWRTVHKELIEAALSVDSITKETQPFVLQTGLDDFYAKYELNAYTKAANQMAATYSRLYEAIQDKFNEAGIEMLSPHYRAHRSGREIAIPAEYKENRPDGAK